LRNWGACGTTVFEHWRAGRLRLGDICGTKKELAFSDFVKKSLFVGICHRMGTLEPRAHDQRQRGVGFYSIAAVLMAQGE